MPITNIDWERVADMPVPDTIPGTVHFDPEPGFIVVDEPAWGEAHGEEDELPPPKHPSLRDIVEELIDLWTWMVYVKHHDWERWQGWERPSLDYFPLCGYTERVVNKLGGRDFRHSICPYCPYVIAFGHRCEDNTEPYHKWTRARDRDIIEKHANEYLQKLLELRKQLILNPDKFKVKKR